MLQITPRDIELFKALNRYRYLRSNFMHRLVGGGKERVRDRIGWMLKEGYLAKPEQQLQSYNARYSPRIYELTPKSRAILEAHGVPIRKWSGEHQFWHRLMISDIMSSFEMIAKMQGLPFKDQWDIVGDRGISLPASIEWDKKNQGNRVIGTLTSTRPFEPDALFAIGNTYFLLEADRGTEGNERTNLHQSSYLRKLLCYRHMFMNKTPQHEWGIPAPIVLHVTTKPDRLPNILNLFRDVAQHFGQPNPKSRRMAFMARPILGSFEKHPEPLLSLLDDTWERVGYPPLVIRNELTERR